MSEMRVEPLHFLGDWPCIQPRDPQLFALAVEYVKANFAEPIPHLIGTFQRLFVVVEYENDVPKQVHGIEGIVLRPDVSLFRTSGPNAKKAFALLFDAMRMYLLEKGWKGSEVLVEYGEGVTNESLLCPNLENTLKEVGAHSAKRLAVTLK